VINRDVKVTFVDLTSRLADDQVADDILGLFEPKLIRRYPAFGVWPADAQLATFLMSWVRGPGFNIPGFRQAVSGLAPNFEIAAIECRMPDWGHSGIISLNGWLEQLFVNGQRVLDWNLKPELVYFPASLAAIGKTVQGKGKGENK
jgi:hypothetical protein